MQAQARQMAAQIAKETDAPRLRMALEQMGAQAEQVPPQMKPLLEYMVSKIEARLAELEKSDSAN
jgi:hypothetical protein